MKKWSLFVLFIAWLPLVSVVEAQIPQSERQALIALYNSTNGDNWTNKTNWKKPDGQFNDPGTECTWYGVSCNAEGTNVIWIILNNNNLVGPLPSELGNLAYLQYLDLYRNKLTGPIPPSLGNLINLAELRLTSNQLTGTIPPALGNLTNLGGLDLGANLLTGSIPSELEYLTNLGYLRLGGNKLTGPIPASLGNLANLSGLWLSNNQLSCPIPPELGNLTNLRYLWLNSNQLTGPIPASLGNLINLHNLFLNSNQLTGTIPNELGNLTNLRDLWLNSNQLTGTIPNELGNLIKLWDLILNSNLLTGPIPPSLGNLINLSELWLHSNLLTGPIPPELGNLTNLRGLWLRGNKLTGAIPFSLTNLTNLGSTDIRWNGLYTTDDTLRFFLNSKQVGGDWENTQTVAPIGVSATVLADNSVQVSWNLIKYTLDSGGYKIYFSTTSGSGYTLAGTTENKSASSFIVKDLNPGTTYFFVVQTITYPHANNQNTVVSEYSEEVSAILVGNTPIGEYVKVSPSPNVSITFSQVTEAGNTTVTTSTTNPGSEKSGFKFLGTYYDIKTNATYIGPVTVCLTYDDSGIPENREQTLKIFHWDGIDWVDASSSLDIANNVICATVSSFSWFAAAYSELITATIDIDPNTINLKSHGQWITCYIELPRKYNVADIIVSSIKLNDTVPAETKPTEIGDYDNDESLDLMVKFNRATVSNILKEGDNKIGISGKLSNGTQFEGSDTVKIIK